MRVKIEGKRTPQEMGELITSILSMVLEEYPNSSTGRYNFYFSVLNKEGNEFLPCDEHGRVIEIITVPDPHKPEKVKRKPKEGKIIQMPDPKIKVKLK